MVTQLVAIMHNSHNLIFPVTWEKVLMLMYIFPKQHSKMTHDRCSLFSNYIFQELEFTGVMRFYYQAQDLGSGQKVGYVQFFGGQNKSVPRSCHVLYCAQLFVSVKFSCQCFLRWQRSVYESPALPQTRRSLKL